MIVTGKIHYRSTAGYKAGEQAVREWLREARANYRQNTLPHLLGEQAGRILPLLDQTEDEGDN